MAIFIGAFVILLIIQPYLFQLSGTDILNIWTQKLNSTNGCVCIIYYKCTSHLYRTADGKTEVSEDYNECALRRLLCCEQQFINRNITSEPVQTVRAINGFCGIRNVNGVDTFKVLNTGTKYALYGEFPWMVAIRGFAKSGPRANQQTLYCGGSLIHPQVVLTAAHCVFGRVIQNVDIIVRAGELDFRDDSEIFHHQDRGVKNIIYHPSYDPSNNFYDAALIILNETFYIDGTTPHISTVCLSPKDFYPSSGEECIATGWGKDKFGKKGEYEHTLKNINLRISPHNECTVAYKKSKFGENFNLHSSFLCAYNVVEGKDTCRGDGGGPLICLIPNVIGRYHQVGVVSWGLECGTPNAPPGVYTNVGSIRDFVDSEMNNLQYGTQDYSITI